MTTYSLHNWCVTRDLWQAPEVGGQRLKGYRNDEKLHRVITSPIVKVEGRNITTQSGSVYVLQEIDPDYLKWMQDNGIAYDPENPIKDRRAKTRS